MAVQQLPRSTIDAIKGGQPFPGSAKYKVIKAHFDDIGFSIASKLGIAQRYERFFLQFYCAHDELITGGEAPAQIPRDLQLELTAARMELPVIVGAKFGSDSTTIIELATRHEDSIAQVIMENMKSTLGETTVSESSELRKFVITIANSFACLFDSVEGDRETVNSTKLATTLTTRDMIEHFSFTTVISGMYVKTQLDDLQGVWRKLEAKGIRTSAEGLLAYKSALNSKIIELFA